MRPVVLQGGPGRHVEQAEALLAGHLPHVAPDE
jgi:hypothetical protein